MHYELELDYFARWIRFSRKNKDLKNSKRINEEEDESGRYS